MHPIMLINALSYGLQCIHDYHWAVLCVSLSFLLSCVLSSARLGFRCFLSSLRALLLSLSLLSA